MAGVCTGAFILARGGLLEGRPATTHSLRREEFHRFFPTILLRDEKLVDTGQIITAGGVSSGIDLGLYLIEQEYGPELREVEAAWLDGPWS